MSEPTNAEMLADIRLTLDAARDHLAATHILAAVEGVYLAVGALTYIIDDLIAERSAP